MRNKMLTLLTVFLFYQLCSLSRTAGITSAFAAGEIKENQMITAQTESEEPVDAQLEAKKIQIKKTLKALENIRKAQTGLAVSNLGIPKKVPTALPRTTAVASNLEISRKIPAAAPDQKASRVPISR